MGKHLLSSCTFCSLFLLSRYDTYHDSAQKGRSVGAVVASMNSTFTKYLSVANLHTNPAQELNDNMCPAIAKALRKYAEINGNLPARIIMYRLVLSCSLGEILNLSI